MFRPTRQEFVFKKAEPAIVAKEWTFDPASILSSPRKVTGKFHTPKIDRDNEYIENAAIQNAVPDFMHLPILHDFHKERTVGIVTRVVELSDGSFDFEGLIKATDDCNDIWELITKGNYDQVSIYGKRTAGTGSCSVRPEQRMEPCTTTGVRLDSISVCDANARNDGTSLFVAKGAKVVFTATDEIIKAETTDSNLMHPVTDYPKEHRDGLPRTKKKCTATCPQYERQELGKGDDMDEDVEQKPIRVGDKAKRKEPSQGEDYHDGKFEKGAESIEQKLDHLCTVVEKLVGMDEGASPHSTDQVEPSGKEEWSEQPNAESDREYGLPAPSGGEPESDPLEEGKAAGDYVHGTQVAAQKLDQRAAAMPKPEKPTPPSSDTLTSDEELNHLAAKYHLDKQAKLNKQRESFIQGETMGRKKLEADSATVDAKAKDPHRPPDYKGEAAYQSDKSPKGKFTEAPTATFKEENKKVPFESSNRTRPLSNPDFKPTTEGASGSEAAIKREAPIKRPESISSESKKQQPRPGYIEAERTESAASKVEHLGKLPQRPWAKPEYSTEHKPFEPKTEEGKKFKQEVEANQFGEKRGKPTAQGGSESEGEQAGEKRSYSKKEDDYAYEADQPEEDVKATPEQESPQEDTNEMPDIESRIDRLISVVERLVQSDKQVHESMGKADEEEEKCSNISKGTETMNDEEVNTIVKAKVEEITKAYQVSLDELKKANTDLVARIDKMEKETIEKSGIVAILRDGDEAMGTVFQSNAAAISSMKPKAKV
jgi:hypothetical protein